jgi:hypothetical protein
MANSTRPAEFLYDNMMIHGTVVHAAHLYHVTKLLYLGSSCIYPRQATQPITEDQLLTGPLHLGASSEYDRGGFPCRVGHPPAAYTSVAGDQQPAPNTPWQHGTPQLRPQGTSLGRAKALGVTAPRFGATSDEVSSPRPSLPSAAIGQPLSVLSDQRGADGRSLTRSAIRDRLRRRERAGQMKLIHA